VKSGWDENHDAVKMFKIEGIPRTALIDKAGKIVFLGHPSQVKLEEKINGLI